MAGVRDLADLLYSQISLLSLPLPEREHRFHTKRQFRFDLVWKDRMLAVEVDGGLHLRSRGRHLHPKGRQSDMDKANLATLMGWRLLTFSGDDVKSGLAVDVLSEHFNGRMHRAYSEGRKSLAIPRKQKQ